MTAKEWLKQIRDIDRRIDYKLEQAHRERARAEKMTTTFGGIGGHGSEPKDLSGTIARLVDLGAEIDGLVDVLVDLKRAAGAAIEGLADGRERDVLEMRYLSGWGWQRIADAMHCERMTIWRWHGEALKKIRIPEKLLHNVTS